MKKRRQMLKLDKKVAMFKVSTVLLVIVSCVSCDRFDDIIENTFYKAMRAVATGDPHKGEFTNCAPTEATFYISWTPDPLEIGKDVIIEGNYTFPEDFETGVMDVQCAQIFSDKYPLKCKDIWDKPCKKGDTAYRKKSMPVPSVVPRGFSFTLTAKLTNDKTQHEIMCAQGKIRIAGD